MNRKGRLAARRTVGPGLHLGKVELRAGAKYVVRMMSGEHVSARLDAGISPEFVDDCLRAGRRLLVADSERGAVIVGALERPPPPTRKSVTIEGETLHLRADQELIIQVGKFGIRLDATGAAKITSRQLVIDAASLVRLLSARVELP
ncbi:MAG: hypothetical protein ACRELB_27525 [Polyangiaceae bacterium]